MLDVSFGRTWPFSATQNLTIPPYDPYNYFYPDRIPSFTVQVSLNNGSFFNLGPALLQTYNQPNFKNYTVR